MVKGRRQPTKTRYGRRYFAEFVKPVVQRINRQGVYSTAGAAVVLGVAMSTVLRWIHQGRLVSKKDSRGSQVLGRDLKRFLLAERKMFLEKKRAKRG